MDKSIYNLLNASAYFLALPYFAGFVYLNSYYEFFSVSIVELKLSEAYIYVNAFSFVLNFFKYFSSWVNVASIVFFGVLLVYFFHLKPY